MGLSLGKTFTRNYNLRIPFLDGFYNVGVFFDKKSTFLLFNILPDFRTSEFKHNVKINMFKNLESSRFCETFIKLHNYKKQTLDIINQFDSVKPEYQSDISFIMNETITLAKIQVADRDLFDILNIFAFTMNSYQNEFIFILTERHNILKRLGKKVVRTSGIQIATTSSLQLLDEYHHDSIHSGKEGLRVRIPSKEPIYFDEQQELIDDSI
jgi:hypothetical protein